MKNEISKVKRNNKWYKVIDQTRGEICVEAMFCFAQPPAKRKLKMWWRLSDCQDYKFQGETA